MIIGITILVSSVAQARSFTDTYAKTLAAITKAATNTGIASDILMAVCWHESNFRTKGATHMDGGSISYGICQMKLATARFMDKKYGNVIKATPLNLEDNYFNAKYAAQYLRYNLEAYDGNLDLALDAYNKGNAVSATSAYVKRVMKSLAYIHKKTENLSYAP